ncbi:MAG: manganese catalase family protein [Thermoanaerobacter sp.]|nr:manganese catalase family protein [Thermoanaerobacter sp.]
MKTPLNQIINLEIRGPDSELSAAVRYLTQRYAMLNNRTKGLLTDIGTCKLLFRPGKQFALVLSGI